MNKKEYLKKLEEQLILKASQEQTTKIINYYDQYFDDARAIDKAIEDVIEELGKPEVLAREVLAGIQLKVCDLFASEALVRMIDLTLIDIRVHVVIVPNDVLTITYQGVEQYHPELVNVEFKSNHLRVIQRQHRIMPWQNTHTPNQNPYLLIQLPQRFKGKILLNTKESRIIIDGRDLETRAQFNITSVNGRIEVSDFIGKNITMLNQTGRIDVFGSTLKTMDLESYSGRIEIHDTKASYVSCRNKHERVTMENNKIDFVEIENEDGRAVVENNEIDDCHIMTVDGRIYYRHKNPNVGLHLDVLSLQGRIMVDHEKIVKGVLNIKDIESRKKEKKYVDIYARSNSGKIEIER